MIIQTLYINNFGGIDSLSEHFCDGVNTIHHPATDELAYALRLVLNHKKLPSLPPRWVRKDTKISASISISDRKFLLDAVPCNTSGFVLLVRDEYGADATEEFKYVSSHCEEQDATETFNGHERQSFLNFLRYLDGENYFFPKELSKNTDGMSDMRAFRAYLAQYLSEFKSEKIRGEKRYVIALKRDGSYDIQDEAGDSTPSCLSATDQKLFQYLCFLNTAEFWHGFENLRNIHCVKKPLIIENFLEHIDISVDVSHLLKRTEDLNRQSIFLTV